MSDWRAEAVTCRLVRHASIREALAAFMSPVEALDDPGAWVIGAESSGDGVEYTVEDFMAIIADNQPCWGFAAKGRGEVHIWVGPDAVVADVVALLGHEYGHLAPRRDDEEERAEVFAGVALAVWHDTLEIMGANEP